jgi:hypothetical protein
VVILATSKARAARRIHAGERVALERTFDPERVYHRGRAALQPYPSGVEVAAPAKMLCHPEHSTMVREANNRA